MYMVFILGQGHSKMIQGPVIIYRCFILWRFSSHVSVLGLITDWFFLSQQLVQKNSHPNVYKFFYQLIFLKLSIQDVHIKKSKNATADMFIF